MLLSLLQRVMGIRGVSSMELLLIVGLTYLASHAIVWYVEVVDPMRGMKTKKGGRNAGPRVHL